MKNNLYLIGGSLIFIAVTGILCRYFVLKEIKQILLELDAN